MKFHFAIFTLALLLSMTACVTNKGMFDDSIPVEEQCTLEIPGTLTVRQFDNTTVSWKAGFWAQAFGVGKAVVQIPTGEHTLILDYWSQSQYGNTMRTSSARGLQIVYNFIPLHSYKIVPKIWGNSISLDIQEINR
jgi:hypothetical protein